MTRTISLGAVQAFKGKLEKIKKRTGYFFTRKRRVEFEGAFYHVIVHGNQRQKIFRDDGDRLYYLERVQYYGCATGLRFTPTSLCPTRFISWSKPARPPLSKIHSSRFQVSKELEIQLFTMLVQNGL